MEHLSCCTCRFSPVAPFPCCRARADSTVPAHLPRCARHAAPVMLRPLRCAHHDAADFLRLSCRARRAAPVMLDSTRRARRARPSRPTRHVAPIISRPPRFSCPVCFPRNPPQLQNSTWVNRDNRPACSASSRSNLFLPVVRSPHVPTSPQQKATTPVSCPRHFASVMLRPSRPTRLVAPDLLRPTRPASEITCDMFPELAYFRPLLSPVFATRRIPVKIGPDPVDAMPRHAGKV